MGDLDVMAMLIYIGQGSGGSSGFAAGGTIGRLL